MKSSDEIPSEHFRDPEEAGREHEAIEQKIAEAEESLKQAKDQLHTIKAVYDCFADTQGIALVVRRNQLEKEESILKKLNRMLNPGWLPLEGRFGGYGYYYPPAAWEGHLIAQKVESETLRGAVSYDRLKKRTGELVTATITYTYRKREEWYTPVGWVGMSGFEEALRDAQAKHRPVNPLYDKLIQEIWQELLTLVTPLSQQVVLKFIPDLVPTNLDQIKNSSGVYKENVPKLEWPHMTKYEAPSVGGKYGFASYEGLDDWIAHGSWGLYQFPEETLKTVWERIEKIEIRLMKQIEEAAREVVPHRQEILLLHRRKLALSLLYMQTPLISNESWLAMQTGQSGRILMNEKQADKD